MRKIHYGWWILFFSFFSLLTVQGARLSFGSFIVPWEQSFSTGRGMISFIGTLSFIFYGLTQPLVGKLIDRWGVRRILSYSALIAGIGTLLTVTASTPFELWLWFGILASIGFGGASSVAASIAVTNWFNKKRGLALGIITSGFGAGQFFMVPLALGIIQEKGWEAASLTLGGILVFLTFPLLLLFLKNRPSDMGLQPYGGSHNNQSDIVTKKAKTQGFNLSFWRHRGFWCLILPYFVCGFTTTGLMDTHLVPFAHDHGFSSATTGTAVSLLALFNVMGTLASGHFADRWSNRWMLVTLYAVRAITVFFLIYIHQPYLLWFFSILFGLVDFSTVAPTTLLATRYFQSMNVGLVLGWLSFGHQVGSALGAFIPGWLFDLTGGYALSFLIATIMLGGAVVLSFMLPQEVQDRQDEQQVVI
ncbi:MFS transporter [Thermoactinomyces sp. CICC 10521]|uniref:MFS transporter n=1 Tax=Thermoactinomyces sp. CICC 10521 TaxID=2767426 RepID=UPI0018DD51B8|nr:MFS transporter [Thermoactinomyces sp. CICC 10521]MBH8608767.1 MFS transporter [Thermoactinomyces sp. CICC 10521]